MGQDNTRMSFYFLGMAIGLLGGWSATKEYYDDKLDATKTTMHNAYHTGDKITVDGIAYHVIVMPEPVELQAYRSEYARRCQAITGKFFEGVGDETNK